MTQGRQKLPPLYSLQNEETHQGDLLQNRGLSRIVGRSKPKNHKAATTAVTQVGGREKRILAQENLICGFLIVGQLTP